jgi:hypothetical protein
VIKLALIYRVNLGVLRFFCGHLSKTNKTVIIILVSITSWFNRSSLIFYELLSCTVEFHLYSDLLLDSGHFF